MASGGCRAHRLLLGLILYQSRNRSFCFLLRSIDSSLGLTMELRSLASLPSFYTFLLYDGSDCLNSLPNLSPRLQAQG